MEEKDEKKYVIPPEPSVRITLRDPAPIIGTITDDMRILNKETLNDETKWKDVVYRLLRERMARGVPYSYYETYQPALQPSLQTIVEEGRRIDVLWEMGDTDVEDATDLQWCQGKVIALGSEENEVKVVWDAMPDIEGWEEATKDYVELDPAMWRVRNKSMGWRLDIDVEQFDNYYCETDLLTEANDVIEGEDIDEEEEEPDGEEDVDDRHDMRDILGESSEDEEE